MAVYFFRSWSTLENICLLCAIFFLWSLVSLGNRQIPFLHNKFQVFTTKYKLEEDIRSRLLTRSWMHCSHLIYPGSRSSHKWKEKVPQGFSSESPIWGLITSHGLRSAINASASTKNIATLIAHFSSVSPYQVMDTKIVNVYVAGYFTKQGVRIWAVLCI